MTTLFCHLLLRRAMINGVILNVSRRPDRQQWDCQTCPKGLLSPRISCWAAHREVTRIIRERNSQMLKEI